MTDQILLMGLLGFFGMGLMMGFIAGLAWCLISFNKDGPDA